MDVIQLKDSYWTINILLSAPRWILENVQRVAFLILDSVLGVLLWILSAPLLSLFISIILVMLGFLLLPHLPPNVRDLFKAARRTILKGFGFWLILFTFSIFFILLTHEISVLIKNGLSENLKGISSIEDAGKTINDFATYQWFLIKSLGLIFLVGLIPLILFWLSNKKGGVIILPFDVTSDLKVENGKDKRIKNELGYSVANLLIEELHRIQKVHLLPRELRRENAEEINLRLGNNNFPPLSSLRNDLGEALNDVGTIEVGKTQLSIGPLLLGLRKLWPFGGVEGVITGSIHPAKPNQHIVVRIEYENKVSAWKVTQKEYGDDILSEQSIRELAYKIAFELISKERLPAGTWKAFRNITEAISSFNKYFRTNDEDSLNKANRYLLDALKEDARLEKSGSVHSEVLADFFYKIGLSFQLIHKENEAKRAIQKALEIDSNYKNLYYYYNALGAVYLSGNELNHSEFQYRRAILHLKHAKNLMRREPVFQKIQFWLFFIIYKLCHYTSCLLLHLGIWKSQPISLQQKLMIFPYPYNGLGTIEFLKGNFVSAFYYYKNASDQDPYLWKPYHNRGNIYLYKNEFRFSIEDSQEAVKEFEKGLSLTSYRTATCHSGLGLAYLFQLIGRMERSILSHQCFDRDIDAINPFPKKHSNYFPVKGGNEELLMKSLCEMKMAIDLDPEAPGYYWNIGLIYLWLPDLHEVEAAWKEAEKQSEKSDKMFCLPVYRCAISALRSENESRFNEQIHAVKEKQGEAKCGYLKMMIKDLRAVKLAIYRHILLESFYQYRKAEEIDKLREFSRKVAMLQYCLREILIKKTVNGERRMSSMVEQ